MENNSNKKETKVLKYVLAALVVSIIAFGMNTFVFSGTDNFINIENTPSQIALRYYTETYGDQDNLEGVYAMSRRLGCHDEIHVYNKEGQPLMKLSYANGKVYEIE